MGGFSKGSSSSGGNNNKTKFGYSKPKSAISKIGDFIKGGGFTGALVRGITKGIKTARTNKQLEGTADFQGTKSRVRSFNNNNNNDGGGNNNPQGIELAKASTTSATILGPAEIQKQAANEVKGPTTTEMSADEILLKNKRRGRKTTNITAKQTLDKNYTLSKKTLLG
mgnify:CR=1 FL=1